MAIQYYQKCLALNPNHKDARASLQLLTKKSHRTNFNIDFLGGENGSGGGLNSSKGKDDFEEEDDRKSRRRHKEGKKKHRKSGTGSSNSDDDSSTSRFSSSGSDDSSRGRSRSKKSRLSKKSKKEASLSPFSKKMAQLNPTSAPSGPAADMGPALPASMISAAYPSTEYPAIATRPMPVPPPFGMNLSFECFSYLI